MNANKSTMGTVSVKRGIFNIANRKLECLYEPRGYSATAKQNLWAMTMVKDVGANQEPYGASLAACLARRLYSKCATAVVVESVLNKLICR